MTFHLSLVYGAWVIYFDLNLFAWSLFYYFSALRYIYSHRNKFSLDFLLKILEQQRSFIVNIYGILMRFFWMPTFDHVSRVGNYSKVAPTTYLIEIIPDLRMKCLKIRKENWKQTVHEQRKIANKMQMHLKLHSKFIARVDSNDFRRCTLHK